MNKRRKGCCFTLSPWVDVAKVRREEEREWKRKQESSYWRSGENVTIVFLLSVEVEFILLWPTVISTGPGNYPLNASYKAADGYAFQDAVGRSLEEIFNIFPGGCLVFFPSYK
ncbi:hypothetical protein Ahy_A02g008339 [Arachis hypogaea]|uniref:Uncharacterized protein n=1 Tax=Arachis hypogaea TaxID=3818 RepID=A0A445EE70_ARAHY|nr:hypothetical protein Ahy_A02g008339 [Arachis hypogaea]